MGNIFFPVDNDSLRSECWFEYSKILSDSVQKVSTCPHYHYQPLITFYQNIRVGLAIVDFRGTWIRYVGIWGMLNSHQRPNCENFWLIFGKYQLSRVFVFDESEFCNFRWISTFLVAFRNSGTSQKFLVHFRNFWYISKILIAFQIQKVWYSSINFIHFR